MRSNHETLSLPGTIHRSLLQSSQSSVRESVPRPSRASLRRASQAHPISNSSFNSIINVLQQRYELDSEENVILRPVAPLSQLTDTVSSLNPGSNLRSPLGPFLRLTEEMEDSPSSMRSVYLSEDPMPSSKQDSFLSRTTQKYVKQLNCTSFELRHLQTFLDWITSGYMDHLVLVKLAQCSANILTSTARALINGGTDTRMAHLYCQTIWNISMLGCLTLSRYGETTTLSQQRSKAAPPLSAHPESSLRVTTHLKRYGLTVSYYAKPSDVVSPSTTCQCLSCSLPTNKKITITRLPTRLQPTRGQKQTERQRPESSKPNSQPEFKILKRPAPAGLLHKRKLPTSNPGTGLLVRKRRKNSNNSE